MALLGAKLFFINLDLEKYLSPFHLSLPQKTPALASANII